VKITVQRTSYGSRSTLGKMYVDGQLECYTLEPAKDNPVHPGHPCIAPGVFKVILTHSPHLGYITPELLDVPGRSEIRIHKANKPEDIKGCTAVGTGQRTDWVDDSHDAFDKIMVLFNHAHQQGEEITAEYLDPQ
jgi:hypothetical protein